ncbi:MAG TPA: hypothetical protein VJY33_26605 [Isosphaeraceae bacterium]|nr:hypothetical protein [Isosphaeraceae bacterium]
MPTLSPTETAVAVVPIYAVVLTLVGAFCFGLVVGWVTYSTLRRAQRGSLSDIATVIGAVAGATILALFPVQTAAFGVYCIGLAVGFFGYLILAWRSPNSQVVAWMGETPGVAQNRERPGGLPRDVM